ncbi:MAG: DUF3822 family protein [Cyclobacteriaceae bacterium]
MTKTATSNFKLIKKIQAESFTTKKLSSYSLCLQIGIRDFQFLIINRQTGGCILLEDYKLSNIKTINSRLEVLKEIFLNHPTLSLTSWDNIKVSFKSHKFSLIPKSQFIPSVASDYLALNSDIQTKIDEVYYYKHIISDAVNVFTADKKVVAWLKQTMANKAIQIVHQGSTFIEGILKYDDHSAEKSLFCYIDRGIIHLAVTQNQKLHYYNQFAARNGEDYLKYMMLVIKELGLSAKSSNVVLWGFVKNDSATVELLKKYIRNINFGSKPSFMKFTREFDNVADHRYFDLYSMFLCE